MRKKNILRNRNGDRKVEGKKNSKRMKVRDIQAFILLNQQSDLMVWTKKKRSTKKVNTNI